MKLFFRFRAIPPLSSVRNNELLCFPPFGKRKKKHLRGNRLKMTQESSQSEISHVPARACSVKRGRGLISQVAAIRSRDGFA